MGNRMKVQDQILLFDVYASQRFWSPGHHQTIRNVAMYLGLKADGDVYNLWNSIEIDFSLDLYESGAEMAQYLRDHSE